MGSIGTFIGAHRRGVIVGAVVVAIPVLALVWWLGSPLFLSKTVDEEFPYSVGAVVPEGMTRAQVDQTMATMAMMDDGVTEAMPEAAPPSPATMDDVMGSVTPEMMAAVAENMTPEMAEAIAGAVPGITPEMIKSAPPEMMAAAMQSMTPEMLADVTESMGPEMMQMLTDAMAEAAPSAPVALKQGMFRDADGFHKGEGSATLYRLPDGSHVLRFEDFQVTNGPDLRVLLASHADPQSRDDVQGPGYVELAKLKGNIGNQNYPLPEGVSPADYGSVVIYCKPFHVVFSVAPLSGG